MLEVAPTSKFKSDLKKFKHDAKVLHDLNTVLKLLIQQKPLHANHVDHPLGGNWKGSRDCHVRPDVLLIYRIDVNQNKLFLERLGSHSDLF